jgi:hypothetical protein
LPLFDEGTEAALIKLVSKMTKGIDRAVLRNSGAREKFFLEPNPVKYIETIISLIKSKFIAKLRFFERLRLFGGPKKKYFASYLERGPG